LICPQQIPEIKPEAPAHRISDQQKTLTRAKQKTPRKAAFFVTAAKKTTPAAIHP
jgi:hypothetical protein